MGAEAIHITIEMVRAGIVPAVIPTTKVVKLLNHKKWHRERLYGPEGKTLLGGKRTGAGKNYVFDTVKVIDLKSKLEGNE